MNVHQTLQLYYSMDYFADKLTGSPDAFIEALLNSRPEHIHLDILTDILTQSSGIDEHVASFINSAWNWVCYHHLWTTSYKSLRDYRKAIGYAETVRPIIQRHKKSELAKLSNSQTILRYWRVPFDQALPSDLRPSIWSKHLLSLIAGLSKRRSHSESIALLRASMTRRPGRGRNKQQLIASDVQRVLDKVVNKGRGRNFHEDSCPPNTGSPNNSTGNSILPTTSSLPEIPSSSVSPISTSINENSHAIETALPTEELASQLLEVKKITKDWESCGCIPICLPLITLLSTTSATFDENLLRALIDWARTISWGSFCSDHLIRLAKHVPGENSQSRSVVIWNLERFHLRGSFNYIDRNCISLPNLCENTELLCRYTGSADAWWRWQRDGFLHIPGFFSYMEELGVFDRIRGYLFQSPIDATDRVPVLRKRGIVQQCFAMLSQMVQRDPAYYAVLVACRPDQNWRLVHSPRRYEEPSPVFGSEDIAFGVPMNHIKALVHGEGTSGIQSTIVYPTWEKFQSLRMVPGFHRQLHSWLQSSLGMKYGDEYEKFGRPQELAVHPGDLVISLPQILRWPKDFSSPNMFNLGQNALEDQLCTNFPSPNENSVSLSSCSGQSTPQHPNDFGTASQSSRKNDDQNWCDASEAIAKALTGELDWTNSKAIEERNLVLGRYGASAVGFVRKSQVNLAKHFHTILDSIEMNIRLEDSTCARIDQALDEETFTQSQSSYIRSPPFPFSEELLSQISQTWDEPSLDELSFGLNHTSPMFIGLDHATNDTGNFEYSQQP